MSHNLIQLAGAYARNFDPVSNTLRHQLVEKGMPPITLPHLNAPSGFCVASPQFGFSEAPIRMVVLRHEHHEKLIAEADGNGQVH